MTLVSALDGANINNGLVVLSTSASVPEPSTWAMGLMGFVGIAGIGLFNRRKIKRCIEA
jgi:PEP-CTERM motif